MDVSPDGSASGLEGGASQSGASSATTVYLARTAQQGRSVRSECQPAINIALPPAITRSDIVDADTARRTNTLMRIIRPARLLPRSAVFATGAPLSHPRHEQTPSTVPLTSLRVRSKPETLILL